MEKSLAAQEKHYQITLSGYFITNTYVLNVP